MSAVPKFKPGRLKDVELRDLGIRFAFGALISAIAGVVALTVDATAGGVFLAFPAILPATLTLIERKESTRKAEKDDDGAALGAFAMIAFAVVAAVTLSSVSSPAALGAATGAWVCTALALYAVVNRRRR
jgi:hypothetical protein